MTSAPLVAVLGSGPAGLVAAWAVRQAGGRPVVYSPGTKSVIRGAQYVHHRIPGISSVDPHGHLEYVFVGEERDYREKVYGNSPVESSWNKFGNIVPYWNMQQTYEDLWKRLADDMRQMEPIGPGTVNVVMPIMYMSHDLIVSTVPAPAICPTPDRCGFEQANIWITPGSQLDELPGDTIVYNGDPTIPWYRTSRIGDYVSTEWAALPEQAEAHSLGKPTHTGCQHWQEVLKVGRYGAWRKEVLVDQVYGEVFERVHQLLS